MGEHFNIHAAKTQFSKLIERAHAGEEITIAKAGKPYAKLVPIREKPAQRAPGHFAGGMTYDDAAFFDPLPDDELSLWEGRDDSICCSTAMC